MNPFKRSTRGKSGGKSRGKSTGRGKSRTSPRKGTGGKRRGKEGRFTGLLPGGRLLARLLMAAGLILVVAGALGSVLWARCGLAGCPDPEMLVTYVPGGAPVLLDRNGEEFASLHPLRWEVVPLEDLPAHLPDAFMAVEDRRFMRHRGVDWIRAVGAAFRNVSSGRRPEGASTLTMQLARSVYPDRISRAERTFRRKLVEVRVARSIEGRFSKERVLELYLNHVYLGAGAHGVEAASRHYFDRDAPDLSLEQAALLAAVTRAPAYYDPRRHPQRAEARRNLVLSLMEAQGRISPEEAGEARRRPLGVPDVPPPPMASTPAPYFVDALRQELEEALGADAYAAGLRIHTTLDWRAQTEAEAALITRLDAIEAGTHGSYRGVRFDPRAPAGQAGTEYLQGAVVMMEAATGDILALVGGRDFIHSRFNRATSGRRQVGSAFKPFVFAAALDAGIPMSQPIQDGPFRLVSAGSPDWSPRNYDGGYRGPVGMSEALSRSLNIPTARLAMEVGIPEVIRAARAAGITSPLPETPALALGTASLSPLELTTAYATLARLGTRVSPRFLLRVEDGEGRVLFHRSQPVPDGGQVEGEEEGWLAGPETAPLPEAGMDPRVAFLVTRMLEDVVWSGTGTGARAGGIQGPVAGKTGTTQDASDVWFVGYTPQRVATVWIGHDRPHPFLAGATGGGLAAPVWGRMMARLQEGEHPPSPWSRPEGIVERTVDPSTGMAVSESCPTRPRERTSQLFLSEYVPIERCEEVDRGRGVVSRMVGSLRGLFGRGRDPEPEVEEAEEAEVWSVEVLEASPASRRASRPSYLGVPPVTLRDF
ncbi:MAG: PBP1A family penicillin-binding protein [Gemmatimonadales bacterium]|nr:MAG: PBP1A family penicillin-binding protein [Gemmatimonadales bacterium]